MDLKFCTSQEDGEICGHLKCASGFKKASRSEYPRLTCAVKNNSWSMTGTTCIPDPKFCKNSNSDHIEHGHGNLTFTENPAALQSTLTLTWNTAMAN
eukprot:260058_1